MKTARFIIAEWAAVVNNFLQKRWAKAVNIGCNATCVSTLMCAAARHPLQQILDAEQRNLYGNSGKLKRAEKRVMVFLRRDMQKQKLRQRTSEHPFGTIKHYDGAGHFLCKGKGKVTAEFALSALSYNIRRAINLCGGRTKSH